MQLKHMWSYFKDLVKCACADLEKSNKVDSVHLSKPLLKSKTMQGWKDLAIIENLKIWISKHYYQTG